VRRTVGLRNRRYTVQASIFELCHGYAQQPRRALYRYLLIEHVYVVCRHVSLHAAAYESDRLPGWALEHCALACKIVTTDHMGCNVHVTSAGSSALIVRFSAISTASTDGPAHPADWVESRQR